MDGQDHYEQFRSMTGRRVEVCTLFSLEFKIDTLNTKSFSDLPFAQHNYCDCGD